MTTASTLSGQLRLNVHPADGALLVGDEPLVHAQLVEEVHTWEASGEETDKVITLTGGRLASVHVRINPVCVSTVAVNSHCLHHTPISVLLLPQSNRN